MNQLAELILELLVTFQLWFSDQEHLVGPKLAPSCDRAKYDIHQVVEMDEGLPMACVPRKYVALQLLGEDAVDLLRKRHCVAVLIVDASDAQNDDWNGPVLRRDHALGFHLGFRVRPGGVNF